MLYSIILAVFLFIQNGFPFFIGVDQQYFKNNRKYTLSELEKVSFVMDTTRVEYVEIATTLARGTSAFQKKKIKLEKPAELDVKKWIYDDNYQTTDHLIIHVFIHMNSGAVMDKYYIFGDIDE